MKTVIKGIIITALCSLCAIPTLGSAKMLPQGVWMLNVYKHQSEITKAGINPNGDMKHWTEVDITDAKIEDVYSVNQLSLAINSILRSLNQFVQTYKLGDDLEPIDTSATLADSWDVDMIHVDIAYGLFDNFTLFANGVYDQSVLKINRDFVEQSRRTDAALRVLDTMSEGESALPSAEAYHIFPETEKADGWRDVYVGFKYQFAENISTTFRATFGMFKIGKDFTEVEKRDGYAELTTGEKHDTYQVFVNYDLAAFGLDWNLLGGHIHQTNGGHQDFLDVAMTDVNFGHTWVFGVGSQFDVIKDTLTFGFNGTYVKSMEDQIRNQDGDFIGVPETETGVTYGSVTLSYKPAIFVDIWATAIWTMSNDVQGQIYEIPGRLGTDNALQFGVKFYYK